MIDAEENDGFRCHNCKLVTHTDNDRAPDRCPLCRCRDFSAVWESKQITANHGRPLLEAIAEWERENGTIAAIMPHEYPDFMERLKKAAVQGSARAAVEQQVEKREARDLIGYYCVQRPEQADRDIANDVLEATFEEKRMLTWRDLTLVATRARLTATRGRADSAAKRKISNAVMLSNLSDVVQTEAKLHGADSPVDRGDAEQIALAILRHLTQSVHFAGRFEGPMFFSTEQ